TAELKADWREALARWKDLVAKFPAHPIGQIGTGRALRWLGHYDESDALLSSLAARHPDEKDIPIEQAELAFARGDWTGALQRWNDLRERYPDDAKIKAKA